MENEAARGRSFERRVAEFLRAAGFEVTPDAKIAKPRQTDLFARAQNLDLLVEVKNRRRKVDVSDVDALRARLHRTASDVVGAIFSTSGLTKGAIKAIELDRTREVLVFVKEEIDQLYAHSVPFRTLLDRKRNELRIHGRAWFGPTVHTEFMGVPLPVGTAEFEIAGETLPYFESRSDFGATSYALEMPDSGWGSLGGEGARLSIQLPLHTVESLRNLFGYLHQKFGLSNAGMFSIHQSDVSWYGAGAENLLRELEQPEDRYGRSRSKAFHHSEECRYFDQFRNGWIEVSCQREVNWVASSGSSRTFLHHAELVIQLPGVPVDPVPFVELCRYTGNDWANFEYLVHRWTFKRRLKRPPRLRAIGKVLSREFCPGALPGERSVSGIVAANPFYKRKLPSELLNDKSPPLDGLKETELLLCSLRHWHDVDHEVGMYRLTGVEVTLAGADAVIRPIGNWDRIRKES